jgi:hypothetical protein
MSGDLLDEIMIGKRIRMCALAVELLLRQLAFLLFVFASLLFLWWAGHDS